MTEPTARERLLTAAVEAFAERGFHATTTRDIAARAGMSPAAVYVHHESKESLLYSVSLSGHNDALAVIRKAAESSDDPVLRVRAMVHDFTYWHAINSRVGRIVQYEFFALSVDHRKEIGLLRREIEREMRAALRDGVADGVFQIDDIPGTALALLSLGVDLVRWFQPGGNRSATDLADLNAHLALRIVGAA
ncbi:TetR/AcrR family transcriptional regulator [soil metagenome]